MGKLDVREGGRARRSIPFRIDRQTPPNLVRPLERMSESPRLRGAIALFAAPAFVALLVV